jgi:hypothetical protein
MWFVRRKGLTEQGTTSLVGCLVVVMIAKVGTAHFSYQVDSCGFANDVFGYKRFKRKYILEGEVNVLYTSQRAGHVARVRGEVARGC